MTKRFKYPVADTPLKKPLNNKCALRCQRDFIAVRPDSEELSVGGLVIPGTAKDPDNPRSGVVLSVGCGLIEGGQIIPLKVKVGDRIHFPRNSGTLIKYEDNHEIGETVFVLRDNQVFGVIEQ